MALPETTGERIAAWRLGLPGVERREKDIILTTPAAGSVEAYTVFLALPVTP